MTRQDEIMYLWAVSVDNKLGYEFISISDNMDAMFDDMLNKTEFGDAVKLFIEWANEFGYRHNFNDGFLDDNEFFENPRQWLENELKNLDDNYADRAERECYVADDTDEVYVSLMEEKAEDLKYINEMLEIVRYL